MDPVTAAAVELVRHAQRAMDQVRLWRERRSLRAAEINLGLLGWQQADFPPDVEEQMQLINTFELEQADLSNRSAEIQFNIDQIQAEIEEHRQARDGLISHLRDQLVPLIESRELEARPLAMSRAGIERFDSAILDLTRTCESSVSQLRELLVIEPQPLAVKERIIWLRERMAAIDNEKQDLQKSRMKLFTEAKHRSENVEAIDQRIEEMNRKIRQAQDDFDEFEKFSQSHISAFEREKANAGKNLETLDKKKSPAFLAIGRCLADFQIEPLNQPEALARVLARRQNIYQYQQKIAESRLASSQMSQTASTVFYLMILLLVAAVAVGALLVLNISARPKPTVDLRCEAGDSRIAALRPVNPALSGDLIPVQDYLLSFTGCLDREITADF